jgi:hypothetical protein
MALKWKVNGASEHMLYQKVDGYEHILRTIDACFSAFTQIAPTPAEIEA